MANRLIIMEVPDVATEDAIRMAIEAWNEKESWRDETDNRNIVIIQQAGFPVG